MQIMTAKTRAAQTVTTQKATDVSCVSQSRRDLVAREDPRLLLSGVLST